MAEVTLGHLLAHALKAEFATMIPGMSISGSDEDWLVAANGMLDKIAAALEVPKAHPLDFTPAEVNLMDIHLQCLGWKPDEESRALFVKRLEDEVLRARTQDLPG